MVTEDEVLKVCKEACPLVDFETDRRLVDDGLLDSLSLMGLLSELSFSFDVTFDVETLTPSNFENIKTITKLINELRKVQ